ncbi:Pectinesterase inhibitor domain protein [Actinidia chinensis var. chinensis]|uniref:Pectinesterase inhibitor domain protein n=1 Tax=Actinidia chinensis var. chinensis TaxID=1590841 RepID=A0A2R6PGQ9_ACTCC|nr:Pectinesterase inhibitor domain protein [Actinidia chinensis var. chinensis]
MKTPHTFSLLALLSAAALFHPTAAHTNNPSAAANSSCIDFIRISCNATLYPDLCYTSLAGYASAVQADPARLARVAVAVSLSRARRTAKYLSNLSRTIDYGGDHRAAAALHDCSSVFGDAVDQILDSLRQMRHLGSTSAGGETLRFQMSNVQTWMSAALTNEDTCTDGFEDISDGAVKTAVNDRVVKVKEVTSNALALVNSYAAKVTAP